MRYKKFRKIEGYSFENKAKFYFHLAAQPLVRESYKNPISTWETNVMGTINLLNSIRDFKNCSVVIVTTDKVYENNSWNYSYRENDALGGYDPYSSSKASVELAVKSWRKSFFKNNIKISTARAGNVIGGGDWAFERIVPDTIKALINKESLILRYPKAVRHWQHVLDPLYGYITLAEQQIQNQKSNEYNFGGDDADIISVQNLVKNIFREWGETIAIKTIDNQPEETNFLTLSTNKAKNELNWFPTWDFDKSISHTVQWYKKVYLGESAYNCIMEDINIFLKILIMEKLLIFFNKFFIHNI